MATPAQYLGTGKRKTSVARVILRPGDGATWVNGKTLEEYFPRMVHRMLATVAAEDGRPRGPVRPARSRARRRAVGPGRRGAPRHRPGARRGEPGAPGAAEAGRLPHARRAPGRAQEGRPAQGAQGAAVQQALRPPSSWLGGTSAPTVSAASWASSSRPSSSSGSAGPRDLDRRGEGLRRPRHARVRRRARGGVRARRRLRRRRLHPRRRPADARGRAARARPRRRHLCVAQPAGVQRRQVLRLEGPQAVGPLGGADRGAPRGGAGHRPGRIEHVEVATDSYLSTSSSASAPT